MKKLLFTCSTRKDLIKVSLLVSRIIKNESELIAEICYCGTDIDYQGFIIPKKLNVPYYTNELEINVFDS